MAERPQMIGVFESPYLHKDWGVVRRFEAIREHYSELANLPWLQMGTAESRTICRLDDAMEGLSITIDRPIWFMREGELTLNLFLNDTRIYSLTFLLGKKGGKRVSYIGAVQGRNLDDIEDV